MYNCNPLTLQDIDKLHMWTDESGSPDLQPKGAEDLGEFFGQVLGNQAGAERAGTFDVEPGGGFGGLLGCGSRGPEGR